MKSDRLVLVELLVHLFDTNVETVVCQAAVAVFEERIDWPCVYAPSRYIRTVLNQFPIGNACTNCAALQEVLDQDIVSAFQDIVISSIPLPSDIVIHIILDIGILRQMCSPYLCRVMPAMFSQYRLSPT